MPNISSFGAQTDNAFVQGTVTDRQMIIPEVPPQGLMSVGPRVTPNFIKEPWSKLISYNFLDVVKDSAGASYIAIKPIVPTSTELANEEFWFKWSDPDAQLNELQEIVKTYNARITQNASAIAEEVARATAAEATKAPTNHASQETIYGIGNELNYGHVKLAADDTPMTSDANAGIAATPKTVNTAIVNSRIRVFGFIGDSFSEATRGRTDWVNGLLQTLLGNEDIYNKAYSGAGFVGGEYATGHNFIDQLNALANEHPEITDLIIFGGNNDKAHLYDGTLAPACNTFAKTLNKRFPGRNVHLFIENFNTNDPTQCWTYTQAVIFAFNALESSNTVNIKLYKDVDKWLFNSQETISNNDFHPNDSMRQYYAMAFAAIINGAVPNMAFAHAFTPEATISNISTTEIVFDNGCVEGCELSFKTSSKSAGQDVFKWKIPLKLWKNITVPGMYDNEFPCSLWIGKDKATLYMSNENASKVTNTGRFYFTIPTCRIRP